MTKAPCRGCEYENEEKVKHQVCSICKKPGQYADQFGTAGLPNGRKDNVIMTEKQTKYKLTQIGQVVTKTCKQGGSTTEKKEVKFDLSGFVDITKDDINKIKPSITFQKYAILINSALAQKFEGMKSCTPAINPTGRWIAFKFFQDHSGLVTLSPHNGGLDINNKGLMKFLNVKPGKYPAEIIGGVAVVEVVKNE